jgi:hypothetical protein
MDSTERDKQIIMEKYQCKENLVPIFQIIENLIDMDYWINKFNLNTKKEDK